jgi:hypothetical protein
VSRHVNGPSKTTWPLAIVHTCTGAVLLSMFDKTDSSPHRRNSFICTWAILDVPSFVEKARTSIRGHLLEGSLPFFAQARWPAYTIDLASISARALLQDRLHCAECSRPCSPLRAPNPEFMNPRKSKNPSKIDVLEIRYAGSLFCTNRPDFIYFDHEIASQDHSTTSAISTSKHAQVSDYVWWDNPGETRPISSLTLTR